MKFRFAVIFVALAFAGGGESKAESSRSKSPLPVYLLLGQSNMVGMRSDAEKLPGPMKRAQNNALFFKAGKWAPLAPGVSEVKGFGPEISFAQSMKGSGKFGIIKVSAGATTLFKEWNPNIGDSLYGKTLDLVQEAKRTRSIKIAGVLWMQGESDGATQEMADSYESNLKTLLSSLRSDLNEPHLPIAACRVTAPSTQFPFIETVRKAQESVQEPGYTWFNCDNLTKGPDNLHYDTQGQIALGQLFAEALKSVR
ncbi:sialate O-acetylesterase [Pseudomonas sp. RGM2987]|uniref:sialate O-acetylesterase n=1 Tax=Pseudomonas sp. RGM2987 TaxID=2930090 RepID=UPI001FD6F7DE|nr:sialate O-acetylesterase [Pseudomonas sp. RGM2987]MCJ8203578.1 sialate O-acetylesterase [Pseudomonas sp. RGM2987]